MKEQFEILILVACGLSLLTLITHLIKQGKIANERLKDERLKFAFDKVLDLAKTIVNSLNQTVVEPLKESDTLKFDEKAQKEVLEKAKAKVKDNLSDMSKDLLKAYLGSEEKLDAYIEDKVESKVHESKNKQQEED